MKGCQVLEFPPAVSLLLSYSFLLLFLFPSIFLLFLPFSVFLLLLPCPICCLSSSSSSHFYSNFFPSTLQMFLSSCFLTSLLVIIFISNLPTPSHFSTAFVSLSPTVRWMKMMKGDGNFYPTLFMGQHREAQQIKVKESSPIP